MCVSALIGPLIGGAAQIGGSLISSSASKSAAKAQANAAALANAQQMQMYERFRNDLRPFMEGGVEGFNKLLGNLDQLTAPVVMDQEALERTPGYQFALKNGLRAVQNSATARGLGVSGAAMKGAADFATGLASNTYQQQFNNEVTNRTNAFNRLMSVSQLGQNSAVGVGAQGTQTANSVSNALIGTGNAQAAAKMASANSWNNALQGIGGQSQAGQFDGLYDKVGNIFGFGNSGVSGPPSNG